MVEWSGAVNDNSQIFFALSFLLLRLTKMMEGGVLRQRRRFWLGTDGAPSTACGTEAVSPLGLKETYTAFLLLGMSAAAAVTILVLECIKHRLGK